MGDVHSVTSKRKVNAEVKTENTMFQIWMLSQNRLDSYQPNKFTKKPNPNKRQNPIHMGWTRLEDGAFRSGPRTGCHVWCIHRLMHSSLELNSPTLLDGWPRGRHFYYSKSPHFPQKLTQYFSCQSYVLHNKAGIDSDAQKGAFVFDHFLLNSSFTLFVPLNALQLVCPRLQ